MKPALWVILATVSLTVAVPLGPMPAQAYEETAVRDGGAIHGRVRFNGAPPAPRSFALIIYPDFEICNANAVKSGYRLMQEVVVSKDGGLRDVFITLEGVERGKPFTFGGPRIAIKNCEFKPFVVPVRDAGPVTIDNQDPIFHDLQVYGSGAGPAGRIRRLLEKPLQMNSVRTERLSIAPSQDLLRIQCGMHAFMQTYARPVTTPYFAVTDDEGRFEIAEIPPGSYRLRAWHPRLGLQETEITVPPNATGAAEFEFTPSQLSKQPPGR